jgi:hypothetical protein
MIDGRTGFDEDLRVAAPLFSNAWLSDLQPWILNREPPKLLNNDGR